MMADIAGGKTVLLLNTSLSAVAAIIFGISQNYPWAVATRVILGKRMNSICKCKGTSASPDATLECISSWITYIQVFLMA